MKKKTDAAILADIHEKALNLLAAATLPVPASTHLIGLKGGLEEIRDMSREAYVTLVEEEG